jgi:hypothetical protein
VDDLDTIVVVLPAGTSRAILLWHDQPTLTRADYTRNRRDLQPRAAGPPTVLVRAKELRSDIASAVRYLFLHFPDATRVDAAVTSIAVVRTVDVLGASASGRMRRTVNGEVRDLFYASSGPIEWRPLDVQVHAELQVGFSPPRPPIAPASRLRRAGGRRRYSSRCSRAAAGRSFACRFIRNAASYGSSPTAILLMRRICGPIR